MRRLGIDRAFAFDEDFKRAGFEMVGERSRRPAAPRIERPRTNPGASSSL